MADAWIEPSHRSLMPVPVSALAIDPASAGASPHGYSREDLENMVRPVPAIYGELRTNPSGPVQSDPTFQKLFQATPDAINADFADGKITVENGSHRVAAAQRTGVPVLPVVVKARDAEDLKRLQQSFRDQYGAPYDSYLRAHAQLEAEHAKARAAEAARSPGREPRGR